MNIFVASTSFEPDYGGPAVSVSRLAAAVSDAGAKVALWAPDGSAMTSGVVPRANGGLVCFGGTLEEALATFGPADVIHDNGIWLPHNHRISRLARQLGVPRIVSTRGMLEPWAIKHKRWKKQLAWMLYQKRDISSANCFHATAEAEAANIRQYGFHVPICVIPNGIDVPKSNDLTQLHAPTRTVLSLGRIHPKKGLDYLLHAWAQAEPILPGWRLRIIGPGDQRYVDSLKRLGRKLGLVRLTIEDAVFGDAKMRAFRDCDLFVLPSHSENFGIAVAEALAASRPVITTKGTPWQDLETRRCGWWIEKGVEPLAGALVFAMRLPNENLREMGARGHEWMISDFGWERVARRFVSVYEGLIRNRQARINSKYASLRARAELNR